MCECEACITKCECCGEVIHKGECEYLTNTGIECEECHLEHVQSELTKEDMLALDRLEEWKDERN